MLVKRVIRHIIRAHTPCAKTAHQRIFKCGIVGFLRNAGVLDVSDQSLVNLGNLHVAILGWHDFDGRFVLARIADDLPGKNWQPVDSQTRAFLNLAPVAIILHPLITGIERPIQTAQAAPVRPIAGADLIPRARIVVQRFAVVIRFQRGFVVHVSSSNSRRDFVVSVVFWQRGRPCAQ